MKNINQEIIAIGLIEHMGDIVACEPIARYLRRQRPNSYIVWCVREEYKELIENNPYINETVVVSCLTEWILLKSACVFDDIYDLHINYRVCPTCNMPLQKWDGNPLITEHTYFNYGSLLSAVSQAAGLPPITDSPKVYISEKIKSNVDKLNLPEIYFTFHCKSNESIKDWEAVKWNSLAEMVNKKLNIPVVEIGLTNVLDHSKLQSINLCGKLSILETAEVINRSLQFIGIDSGPAHLANAVGTFGIILLGKYKNYQKYIPFSGDYLNLLNADLLFSKNNVQDIEVETVFNSIVQNIESAQLSQKNKWNHEKFINEYESIEKIKVNEPKVRALAFYLPQFHTIPENDKAWGKGFTEWHNVSSAKPMFGGHYQPQIPSELGFYDLKLDETINNQAELARQYGIEGFSYWHYWFGGKMLLEKPLERLLELKEVDISYCIGWANESWSKRWDGGNKDLIQEQVYPGEEDDIQHFNYLLKFFNDSRYIKINKKPVFLIYRANLIPDIENKLSLWRELATKNGLDGIYLIAIKTIFEDSKNNWTIKGFDAELIHHPNFSNILDYETLQKNLSERRTKKIPSNLFTVNNVAHLYDYENSVYYLKKHTDENFSDKSFSTVLCSWDNTPRVKKNATVLKNYSPSYFYKWFCLEIERIKNRNSDEKVIFINAWNEWAEGMHLEPDNSYGHSFLEAAKCALYGLEYLEENKNYELFKETPLKLNALTSKIKNLTKKNNINEIENLCRATVVKSAKKYAIDYHSVQREIVNNTISILDQKELDSVKKQYLEILLLQSDLFLKKHQFNKAEKLVKFVLAEPSLIKDKQYLADLFYKEGHSGIAASLLQLLKDEEIVKTNLAQNYIKKSLNDKNRKNIKYLFVRTDSIGDNILGLPIIQELKNSNLDIHITVLCQNKIGELYQNIPYVDDIIVFDRYKMYQDENYRNNFVKQLRSLKFDCVLNPVYSREIITDLLAIGSAASVRIAHQGDISNITKDIKDQNNSYYTKIVLSDGLQKTEIDHNIDFLAGLGLKTNNYKPVLPLDKKDIDYAEAFYNENQLDPAQTIVIFPFSQQSYKDLVFTQEIIKEFQDYNLVIMGAESDYSRAENIYKDLNINVFNLSGKTKLTQSAAIIKKCKIVVSCDTAGAHIACAVGKENIIVMGGGHFGRFLPYSNLTSIIALPLECYGCNWQCKYSETFCFTKLESTFVIKCINDVFYKKLGEKPKIYVQSHINGDTNNYPRWKWFDEFIKLENVEIISFESFPELLINEKSTSSYRNKEIKSEGNPQDTKIKVSAIVSTYKSEKFIEKCLDDLIEQSLYKKGELEIIVIDSASPENEKQIVENYKNKYKNIYYFRTNERETIYQAWNRGIKASVGKFVTNANTDDRHSVDALEKMADFLEKNESIGVVYANSYITNIPNDTLNSNTPKGKYNWIQFDKDFILFGCFIGPQPMWRKSIHNKYGYFDENLKVVGDYEYWLRISQDVNFYHLDEYLGLYYASIDSAEHRDNKLTEKENIEVKERYFKKYVKTADDVARIKIKLEHYKKVSNDQNYYEAAMSFLNKLISEMDLEKSNDKNGSNNSEFQNLFLKAYNDYSGKQLTSALASIESAERIFNQNESGITLEDIYLLKGYIYLALNSTDNARQAFKTALQNNPNSSDACKGLADIFLMGKMYPEAKTMYEWAVKNNPNNTDAKDSLHKVNNLLSVSPATDSSSNLSNDLMENIETEFDELVKSSYLKLEKKEYEFALLALYEAEDIYDETASNLFLPEDVCILRGTIYMEIAKYEKAQIAFEKALNINPQSSEACRGLGEVFFKSDMINESKVMFEWAVKNDPENSIAAEYLAKVNSILGLVEAGTPS